MPAQDRPRIGFTTSDRIENILPRLIACGILWAGGQPVRISPNSVKSNSDIAALILGGGIDIHPGLYGKTPQPGQTYDPGRDELEAEWIDQAAGREMPVLGICRGAQMLNVHAGGTLHQDVAATYGGHYPQSLWAGMTFRKPVSIKPGSHLAHVMGQTAVQVSSLHIQAIDRLGTGLVASAQEPNGVIQAIEQPGDRFVLGVQFHPEAHLHQKLFRRLFEALVNAAKT